MTNKNINKKDIVRQILNVVFSISQIVFAFIFTLLGIGRGIADQSNTVQTPVIPAGYAFSIWGLIFLLDLIYAYYQALPENQEESRTRSFQQIRFNVYRR